MSARKHQLNVPRVVALCYIRQSYTRDASDTNSPERQQLIQKACTVLQQDAPCCWGFHPSSVILSQPWLKNYRPHDMTYNTLQYLTVDVQERQRYLQQWNKPRIGPVAAVMMTAATLVGAAILTCGYRGTRHGIP